MIEHSALVIIVQLILYKLLIKFKKFEVKIQIDSQIKKKKKLTDSVKKLIY